MTQLTSELKTIREAINILKRYVPEARGIYPNPEIQVMNDALYYLNSIEGNLLPELPDGWRIEGLGKGAKSNMWSASITDGETSILCGMLDPKYNTPRDAVLSAIRKIKP